jgi:cob(I)alamin adenosyltransferase
VQNDLFDVGADLCTPVVDDPPYPPLRVTPDYTERLEQACDRYNAELMKLSSFILPGGTPAAALLHVSRTVVRRAERSTWSCSRPSPTARTGAGAVPQRLSDLLFILSRAATPGGDVLWAPGGGRG